MNLRPPTRSSGSWILTRGPGSTEGGIWSELLIVAALAASGAYIAQQWTIRHPHAGPSPQVQNVAALPNLQLIAYQELQQHDTRESCWILVRGQIYDVTDFLAQHPGGALIILSHAGRDATAAYSSHHPPALLDNILSPSQHLGAVDPATLPPGHHASSAELTEDEQRVKQARAEIPPLNMCISVQDLEDVAKKVMSKVAWGYCMSGADTMSAYKNNIAAFSRYAFRPRVLRPVSRVDTSCSILGNPSALPIFVSPAANAGLGHPLGELGIVRGAAYGGIIQGVASTSTLPLAELEMERKDGQTMFFQLYVNKDRQVSERLLREAERRGFKAVLLTVDTPVPGKREMDLKTRGLPTPAAAAAGEKQLSSTQAGIANSLGDYFDANLCWDDLAWLRSVTKLPIILKGVQTVEDVELAVQHGCEGVLLSNHGGRQLDYARAPIDVLYEVRKCRPDILDEKKIEVYLDGGVRRGTDVVKALCLGATAVGMGRPLWYANAAYGQKGVVKLIDIMAEEIATAMRLLGVTNLSDLKPEMISRISNFDPRKPYHLPVI
ncbi:hypothetical protein DACRYDRAFT_19605 [Dacryopinax primogenitus]|uniref:L-lactate dehydrogenase (cytochrome) n=1 Tax=Dacryopinax primogenitus (strain DJM 731) TaxID=1858805 RepID=M5GCV8_DACPD|nr:uncharacterized protein DACRYDRAFT_19605 [Dacryopinax primogenitus]EJU06455.1 hypothetical protein DACRYDRAFT_19605 [Dacryopinax primogenitus]